MGGGFAWRDAPTGLVRGLYGFTIGMLLARHYRGNRTKSVAAWVPIVAAAALMWLSPPHAVAYDICSIVLAIPLIVFMASIVEPSSDHVFGRLGDISYAVYALHNVSFSALEQATGISSASPARYIGALILASFLVLCGLLDHYYDRPIRKALASRIPTRVERMAAP